MRGRVRTAYCDRAADIAFSLAVAEVMLERAQADAAELVCYLWRPAAYGVVLGSACRYAQEVDRSGCATHGVGVYRRLSGGGTVVVGPETWCYSLLWSRGIDPGTIRGAFSALHGAIVAVLRALGLEAFCVPISDLAVRGGDGTVRKLAGHAQKRTRNGVLCEGTLCGSPLPFRLSDVLPHPPREPEYREGRSHEDFVTTVKACGGAVDFERFCRAVLEELEIADAGPVPEEMVARARALAAERYLRDEWTRRL